MGKLELDYDPRRNQFRFHASVELTGSTRQATARMVVDTGTNRSAISESVAAELGVDLASLEVRDTGGVTAIEARPRRFGVTLWIVGSDVARLSLPEVVVLTDLRRKAKRGRGGRAQRPEKWMEAQCLLGMDALRALKGRAILDPARGEGWIDW